MLYPMPAWPFPSGNPLSVIEEISKPFAQLKMEQPAVTHSAAGHGPGFVTRTKLAPI